MKNKESKQVSRRTVLRSVNLGVAAGGLIGTAATIGSANQNTSDNEPSGPSSRLIDIALEHDVPDNVPVYHADTFRMSTYRSAHNRLYYVAADASEYLPGRPVVRSPFGTNHLTASKEDIHLGNVIDSDISGAYKRLIDVESYSVEKASINVGEQSTQVEVEDFNITVKSGKQERFKLKSRTIEVPIYEKKTISVNREGYSGERETWVQTDSSSVEVTPFVSVADHGYSTIVRQIGARIFPETMPGANALWYSAKPKNREKNNGIITITGGQNG